MRRLFGRSRPEIGLGNFFLGNFVQRSVLFHFGDCLVEAGEEFCLSGRFDEGQVPFVRGLEFLDWLDARKFFRVDDGLAGFCGGKIRASRLPADSFWKLTLSFPASMAVIPLFFLAVSKASP